MKDLAPYRESGVPVLLGPVHIWASALACPQQRRGGGKSWWKQWERMGEEREWGRRGKKKTNEQVNEGGMNDSGRSVSKGKPDDGDDLRQKPQLTESLKPLSFHNLLATYRWSRPPLRCSLTALWQLEKVPSLKKPGQGVQHGQFLVVAVFLENF